MSASRLFGSSIAFYEAAIRYVDQQDKCVDHAQSNKAVLPEDAAERRELPLSSSCCVLMRS
jgi:hypothetical protein